MILFFILYLSIPLCVFLYFNFIFLYVDAVPVHLRQNTCLLLFPALPLVVFVIRILYDYLVYSMLFTLNLCIFMFSLYFSLFTFITLFLHFYLIFLRVQAVVAYVAQDTFLLLFPALSFDVYLQRLQGRG